MDRRTMANYMANYTFASLTIVRKPVCLRVDTLLRETENFHTRCAMLFEHAAS